ncbi:M20/M25/M40 family metallo-hydrolase [Anaerovibrio sp.]|uniref:M20/M25/M40 family metallo-hydrolase n=1 Tax=Anaerovibrio sp. TaxID=1872532 RepID=UPI003F139641
MAEAFLAGLKGLEEQAKVQLRDEFLELIGIDAPSWGEQAIGTSLQKKLAGLGMEVRRDEAGNLYGYLPGELARPPILLSAHMDTVEPSKGKQAVTEPDGTIRSAGDAVLGADCVAGLVEILQGIRLAQDSGRPHRPVEILFSVAEETYCEGLDRFDFSQVKSRESYVLDLTGTIGSAALKAPTLVSFQASVRGRAAHAGMEPEKGINAIAIMAKLLGKIPQGHLDAETTCNIGTIEGGRMINIVPELCTIRGEVRGYNHERVMEIVADIERLATETAEAAGAGADFTYKVHIHSYATPAEADVVTRFQQSCRELGLAGDLTETFGGSDQNPLSRQGIQGIVLSNGMYKMHTTEEYTTIEDLWQGSRLVAGLILSEV